MPDIGVPELLIIAAIVLLVFGPGKAADLGASLGKGIREFRKATKEEDPPTAAAGTNVLASAAGPAAGADQASVNGAPAPSGRFCTECGTACVPGQKFCTNCGTSLAAKAS